MRDIDLISRARHWARTGLGFVLCDEPDEAQATLDTADRLLRNTVEPESVEVLEVDLLLRGYYAHAAWARGDVRQVIRHVEQAHALLERRGGAQLNLSSSRLYLAEQVAWVLAARGHELIGHTSTPNESARIQRRDVIRLLDLGLSLLGGCTYNDDACGLSDRILRLRAWLCMQEDEVDVATQSLSQHSAQTASEEYMLIRCALLFRSGQPSEGSAQLLEWLKSQPDLSHEAASDAVQLLVESEAPSSALAAVRILTERLTKSELCLGSAEAREFSELQEIKFKLLTETVPDSAAAAEHLEMLLDGQMSGRLPLEESTLRTFAAKLWASACDRYGGGDLHHAIEDLERAWRFLESTSNVSGQARLQATLAHLYLQQDRLDQAIDRGNNALKLAGASGEANACEEEDDEDDGFTGPGSAKSLALIVLVKARVKQGDTTAAHAQIETLLSSHDEPLLLASVCEELASLGNAYHDASITLLEQFVSRVGRCAKGDASRSAEVSLEKLASSTRSLVTLRLHAAATKDKESGDASGRAGMRGKLLRDLQLIARRAHEDGAAAISDDPAHLEWLADAAWQQALLEAPRQVDHGAERDASLLGDGRDDATASLEFCADFLSAACELLAALPQTEARLHTQLCGMTVVCRCALRLSATAKPSEVHLKRAASVISSAFLLYQRHHQIAKGHGSAVADGSDPLPSILAVLNYGTAHDRTSRPGQR